MNSSINRLWISARHIIFDLRPWVTIMCFVLLSSPLGAHSKCSKSHHPCSTPGCCFRFIFFNLLNKGPQRHIRPLFITNELRHSLVLSVEPDCLFQTLSRCVDGAFAVRALRLCNFLQEELKLPRSWHDIRARWLLKRVRVFRGRSQTLLSLLEVPCLEVNESFIKDGCPLGNHNVTPTLTQPGSYDKDCARG